MSDHEQSGFDSWAVVELLGHVRTAGRVTEEERFGVKMGRCDVPRADGGFTTFYFGGGSVYRMTPCTEDAAKAVAIGNQPEPVHRWELPKPESEEETARSGKDFGSYIRDMESEGRDDTRDMDF